MAHQIVFDLRPVHESNQLIETDVEVYIKTEESNANISFTPISSNLTFVEVPRDVQHFSIGFCHSGRNKCYKSESLMNNDTYFVLGSPVPFDIYDSIGSKVSIFKNMKGWTSTPITCSGISNNMFCQMWNWGVSFQTQHDMSGEFPSDDIPGAMYLAGYVDYNEFWEHNMKYGCLFRRNGVYESLVDLWTVIFVAEIQVFNNQDRIQNADGSFPICNYVPNGQEYLSGVFWGAALPSTQFWGYPAIWVEHTKQETSARDTRVNLRLSQLRESIPKKNCKQYNTKRCDIIF
jgi:hypothetical protein